MGLKSRLAVLDRKLRDPNVPSRWLIVIADGDGRWWDGETEIDPAAVDPRTRVIIIGERPDDPQSGSMLRMPRRDELQGPCIGHSETEASIG
jgi:hypothetical protein